MKLDGSALIGIRVIYYGFINISLCYHKLDFPHDLTSAIMVVSLVLVVRGGGGEFIHLSRMLTEILVWDSMYAVLNCACS